MADKKSNDIELRIPPKNLESYKVESGPESLSA